MWISLLCGGGGGQDQAHNDRKEELSRNQMIVDEHIFFMII